MIAVDVGNTSLHIAWISSNGKILKIKQIPTLKAKSATLEKFFLKHHKNAIIVCSVVPQITKIFRALKRKFDTKNIQIVTEDIIIPIKCFYDKKSVGADRLVAAFAAKQIYKNSRIIIDFGTAITFDILSKKGDYLGGLILPGLGSTLKVLSSCALLPKKIKLRSARMFIPRDTHESINKGIEEGFALMINSLIEKYKRILKIKNNSKVVITGGDAKFILRSLKSPIIFDRFLVVRGLSLLAAKFIR